MRYWFSMTPRRYLVLSTWLRCLSMIPFAMAALAFMSHSVSWLWGLLLLGLAVVIWGSGIILHAKGSAARAETTDEDSR